MNASSFRRTGLILILLCGALLIPLYAAAQETPPVIPHPVEHYRACLVCHETGLAQAPPVPEDHAGRANEICQDCHLTAEHTEAIAPPAEGGGPPAIPHTLQGNEVCTDCHNPTGNETVELGGVPQIPHTLIGRENCLACHETGVGGAPKVPDDHAGRTSDICQACHEPGQEETAAATTGPEVPVPTPLAYPRTAGIDTCVDCHESLDEAKQVEIVDHWRRSIHAERNVICADCHGGNPAATTIDEAMSPAAGYIGVPAKMDIPALCASCHADVGRMRQYDLPTDQYAKYQESVHGVRLARGDKNVATCADCHGDHEVLKANDPGSRVYPANVPALCASCHADPEFMAPYGIPTDQYDLYRESVHGHALLDKQDFRAPNCATCHGTHGAAPPGYEEVSNVCGSCHSATQGYYLKGPHANAEGGPKCVTCHGRYDVSEPSEELYQGSEPRHCGSCHPSESEPGQTAQTLYDTITGAATAYDEAEESIASARKLGMLVPAQENQLRQANTDLITSRAAQHTVDAEAVAALTEEAVGAAEDAKAGAEEAIGESVFRRQAMVVAVLAILLVIVALYMIKRELDKQLENHT